MQLNLFREIIVDNFAGGGGASTGIEMATGLNVDVAINHDPAAIAMHKANHPHTEHYCESVWDVDPREVVKGRKVGLCWLSPDCKHFSKAKGGKPVDKTIRGLAWIGVRWAATVRPRVIILENVEEFQDWGPLKGDRPDPDKKGKTFQSFVRAFKRHGYEVDFKVLKACDYGAPTTRQRLFLIARCDGQPITWPEASHAEPNDINVQLGLKKPYRTAAEVIDWQLTAPSIFTRKKPLKENTLIRIARGINKFVIEPEEPFIVNDNAHFIQHYYTHQGPETRGSSPGEPLATIPTANRFGLVTAFLAKHYGGNYTGAGIDIRQPLHTITTVDHHSLVTAFLTKYYGQGIGQSINEPIHTIPTKDRFGLVTVHGENYKVTDIGMRMLQPRELFLAQGFPNRYIIGQDYTGKKYPKSAQVARVGNSVPPPFANALVRANLPEMCLAESRYAVST
ncbi:DNA cytosine methyltransferase [Jeotgalibacillus haloalkalitolerans]|uniref:DNA (cytosine-5-)-methyltransferase n=1 Tax=Jeotgalibacillus haloalkalitolerans TaxID=3104292 RepID=A0ABU5KNK6_9BACL|nr:DNA cytosine methyltransferase [Jeotgalibacillus sp. HH7-29]MDZ5712260.1 DNA cytosine methyltransferase [Jeotgalibacillus sp. HH7-29]